MFHAITRIMNEIVSTMNGCVYGAWLYGSVALDDFRLGWSDIDFVALIHGPISENQAERLLTLRQDMLKTEPRNLYYRSFEGVIASLDEYRSQSFQRLVYWGTSGQRITDRYIPDPFSLFELSKYGIPVYGGKPWILPAPGKEELASAVRRHYDTIRKYACQTDESLYSCGWLLDIARCIYTLRHYDVISKTQAGIWALEEHLFPDDTPLRKTIEIRQHPLSFKGREDIKLGMKELGPVVQNYADVLEHELFSV
ncbi:MAG: nucleotidyltransferase domain-containing protein [Clostridia bacterium]|nr:nucleotidyltransferase domain-containing protein [Clostridia bacterium]